MERYAPYSRPYFSGTWQLLCSASPVAVSLQDHYGCFWWLFRLVSHRKPSFALSIHLEDGVRGVSISANPRSRPGMTVLMGKTSLHIPHWRRDLPYGFLMGQIMTCMDVLMSHHHLVTLLTSHNTFCLLIQPRNVYLPILCISILSLFCTLSTCIQFIRQGRQSA